MTGPEDDHGSAVKRVIQFSTGNVGRHALRMLIERPELDLVGVHAHGADKIGRDAAQLCGLDTPTGVLLRLLHPPRDVPSVSFFAS
jgi:hypothetical protein